MWLCGVWLCGGVVVCVVMCVVMCVVVWCGLCVRCPNGHLLMVSPLECVGAGLYVVLPIVSIVVELLLSRGGCGRFEGVRCLERASDYFCFERAFYD